MASPLWIILSLIVGTQANLRNKICWEECSQNVIQTAEIEGCHRRSSFPFSSNFRCRGASDPPCTVQQLDTVHLKLGFTNPGLRNVSQSVVWVTGYGLDMPWVGMDTEVSPYLDGGRGCVSTQPGETSEFYFPILIQEYFPRGRYDLKWTFIEHKPEGDEEKLCLLFRIRIT